MRIVFLDFDGVLNFEQMPTDTTESESDRECWSASSIDGSAVERLNTLIARTGAHVVVSSTWRKIHSLQTLRELLARKSFRGTIIGVTPQLYRTPDGYKPVRGDEIQRWLDDHPMVSSYVILDDDADMGHLESRLVRTNPAVGLTHHDVERALVLMEQLPEPRRHHV